MYNKQREVDKQVVENINQYFELNNMFTSKLPEKLNLTEQEVTMLLYGKTNQLIHKYAQEISIQIGKPKDFFYHKENIKVEEEKTLGMSKIAFNYNFNEQAQEGLVMLEQLIDLMEEMITISEKNKETT